MLDHNIILATDSYKLTQYTQYPKDTVTIGSYFESRGGQFSTVVWNGLQPILMNKLVGEQVTTEKIDEAEEIAYEHFGKRDPRYFYRKGWEYIRDQHDGRLPLRIKALPEGYRVQVSNALMTVQNTDPNCFWLTSYVEGLLHKVWYPTTVATLGYHIKQNILSFLEKNGDPSSILFKLHDFGYRGVSSEESSAMGGAAALLNFRGTDTLAGIRLLKKYYKAGPCGFSIFASEHSTITSWGKENEAKAMENILDQCPDGFCAIVSDSYDIFNACKNIIGGKLKEKIMLRNGTLVVRPDSGDPTTVVLKIINILGEAFGYSVNFKGYKVLPPIIRIIQGDGVNYYSINKILNALDEEGWSSDNIAFGMGGAYLQSLTRDLQKCAFKCSFRETLDGKLIPVQKQPITDSGKNSKKGKLTVQCVDGHFFRTIESLDSSIDNSFGDRLVTVFENGDLTRFYSYDEVINNVERKSYGHLTKMTPRE